MISDDEIRAVVDAHLPIDKPDYKIELVDLAFPKDAVMLTLRVTTLDNGEWRDIKEQEIRVLEPWQRDARGLAFLEVSLQRAKTLDGEQSRLIPVYE